MADLSKSSTQWKDQFFRRFLAFLMPLHILRDLSNRLRLEQERFRNLSDYNGNVAAVTLTGIVHGTNTDDRGRLFVRVTGAGPYTIKLYKATGGGGGDEMATGSAAADGTATMTAVNGSGITGQITLGSSVTVEEDDVHYLACYLDLKKYALNVFASDGTTDKDTQARNEYEDMLGQLANQVSAMKAIVIASLSRHMIRYVDGSKGYGSEFLLDGSTTLISESVDRPGSGEVRQLYQGILLSLRQAMADDSNGEQDVVKLTPSATAATFSSSNDGQGSVLAHTPEEHCPAGRHTFTCAGDDVGSEFFTHTFVPTDPALEGFSVRGPQVGQSYKGPRGFGPITVERTLLKTGDGSNLNLAAASSHSVSGETGDFTDGGILYWSIVSNGSNWDVSFFRSSNRTDSDLVAKAENVATGASFVASAKRGSGITVNGTVGSGPTSTTTGTLDLQAFKVQNGAESIPDRFYIDTTVAANGGVIQSIVAEELAYFLNSDTSGSETISDDLVKANSFEDYVPSV